MTAAFPAPWEVANGWLVLVMFLAAARLWCRKDGSSRYKYPCWDDPCRTTNKLFYHWAVTREELCVCRAGRETGLVVHYDRCCSPYHVTLLPEAYAVVCTLRNKNAAIFIGLSRNENEAPRNTGKLIVMLMKAKWHHLRSFRTLYGTSYSQEWGEGVRISESGFY